MAYLEAEAKKILFWFDCPTLYDDQYDWQEDECPNPLVQNRNTKVEDRHSEVHRIPGHIVRTADNERTGRAIRSNCCSHILEFQ
jgi:hypothetical protein